MSQHGNRKLNKPFRTPTAKKKGNLYGKVIAYEPTFHKTSIGRNPSKAKMNKHKRRMFKKYRGQGKWNDQTFILMVSLYLTRCHKILDHHKVEVHAVIVVCSHKETISAVSTGLEESKILMSVTNGDQDILEDNV